MAIQKPDKSNSQRKSTGAPDEEKEASPVKSVVDFDSKLQRALDSNELFTARSLVADAEAVLAAHNRTIATVAHSVTPSKSHLASAKARIAMSTGDHVAARAILVQAIERWPDVTPLRAMMTEVMLASGRAKDVRPVLTHLGRSVAPQTSTNPSGGEKKDFLG